MMPSESQSASGDVLSGFGPFGLTAMTGEIAGGVEIFEAPYLVTTRMRYWLSVGSRTVSSSTGIKSADTSGISTTADLVLSPVPRVANLRLLPLRWKMKTFAFLPFTRLRPVIATLSPMKGWGGIFFVMEGSFDWKAVFLLFSASPCPVPAANNSAMASRTAKTAAAALEAFKRV